MKSKKIIVIGSSNTDMVLKSKRLPAPGETVLGKDFTINPGGKGANQAVAAAKLEGDVTFITKVGNDMFGKQAIEGFQTHGIDTQFVIIDSNTASGVALITVDEKGENAIAVALGANATLNISDIYPALTAISESAYVLTQLETPLAIAEYISTLALTSNFKFILNPAPAQILSDALLKTVYIITPNTVEAELLTGVAVVNEETARAAAVFLRAKGVTIVIITMGAKGAYVLSEELDSLIPSPQAKAVDTTAAGDTFNGALVVALAEGQDLKSAIVFANTAAAYSVGILGAQISAPSRSALKIPHQIS